MLERGRNKSFRTVERLLGVTHPLPDTARANLDAATRVLAGCFSPVSPTGFAKHCPDARSRAVVAGLASSFPDAAFRVDWASADDRRVVFGGRLTGTHAGPWRGVPATGRSIATACVTTFGLVGGRVADVSIVIDSYAVAEQIGVVPIVRAGN